jgi:hypothetical protein
MNYDINGNVKEMESTEKKKERKKKNKTKQKKKKDLQNKEILM